MAKLRNFHVTVVGIRTQRGHNMVKITDYPDVHFDYASELVGNFNGVMARMADRGIIAVGEKASAIRSQLADLTFDENQIVYDTGGWNGLTFVNGDGRAIVPEGGLEGHVVFTAPADRYRTAGTLDDWLAEVAQPIAGQMVGEFCLGLMFAGPLVSLARQTINPGFALIGPPEDGKSALLTIAASACGAPKSSNEGGGYPLSFAGTSNGIEWEMQNYADLTMIIDEAALFGYGMSEKDRGRALIDLSMRLAEGREKHRFKTIARHFNFFHITTSNEELTSMIAGAAPQSMIDAVATRFSSISLTGRPNGALDSLPKGVTDKGDFLGPVLAAADRNHGVALPHYLRQLVALVARDPEAFEARLLGHLAAFRQAATLAQPRKASRRVLDSYGLVYVASRLAQHFGVLPPSFSPMASTLATYRLHLKTHAPPRPMEVVTALLEDPEVPEIKRGQPLQLTKRQFEEAKAFKLISPRYTELLMTPDAAEAHFEGWNKVRKQDEDIKRLLIREEAGKRYDTYRSVRVGKRDRMVCLRIARNSPLPWGKRA